MGVENGSFDIRVSMGSYDSVRGGQRMLGKAAVAVCPLTLRNRPVSKPKPSRRKAEAGISPEFQSSEGRMFGETQQPLF